MNSLPSFTRIINKTNKSITNYLIRKSQTNELKEQRKTIQIRVILSIYIQHREIGSRDSKVSSQEVICTEIDPYEPILLESFTHKVNKLVFYGQSRKKGNKELDVYILALITHHMKCQFLQCIGCFLLVIVKAMQIPQYIYPILLIA